MKLIYIAGPYTGPNFSVIDDNIKRAEEVAIQLWAAGWAVFCPHLNTAHFERYERLAGLDYETWISGTMEILKRCDAIFMMKAWTYSTGAKMEHQFAIKNNKNIYYEKDGIPEPGHVSTD